MTSYKIDDFNLARDFILSLPNYIKKKRFTSHAANGVPKNWTPDHLVVATRAGKAIALADLVDLSSDNAAAALSIIAADGQGAYAIKALEKLKTEFPRNQWTSSLKEITPALKAISFRHVDVTFDQIAKEISSYLIETHGFHPEFIPPPVFVSQRTLKRYGLLNIKLWTSATVSQFIFNAKNSMKFELIAPSGVPIDPPDFQAMAFDVLNCPESERQGMARMMIVFAAMRHGHKADTPFMQRAFKHKGAQAFIRRIADANVRHEELNEGIFKFREKDQKVILDAKRKLGLPEGFRF